jgi:hypothetical protein
MSAILSSLKLVNAKRPTQVTPVQARRNKLSNKLYEQIKLATALRDGNTYAPLRLRSVRDRDTGEIKRIEQPKRIRPWFFTAENGKVCVQIKYGSKTLDIGGKGKNSAEVASGDELIKVLELIKTAVETGELDGQLESAGMKLREGFSR